MTISLRGIPERLGEVGALDQLAQPLADVVAQALRSPAVKDALTGARLGHPVHPLLTDIPIGSFTSATVLDLVGGRRARRGADLLIALGVLSAVPTIAAGAADWSDMTGAKRRIGVVHALANGVGVGCYVGSLVARARGRRARGTVLALAGMSSMTFGGLLGGHLAFSE